MFGGWVGVRGDFWRRRLGCLGLVFFVGRRFEIRWEGGNRNELRAGSNFAFYIFLFRLVDGVVRIVVFLELTLATKGVAVIRL